VAATAALTAAWTNTGGLISRIVGWPPDAASWPRPARDLIGEPADAGVVADNPAGFAQLAHRLAREPKWSPTRTYAFGSVASPDLLRLTPVELSGLSGATAAGAAWSSGTEH
jgi:hypothetical protein